MYLILEISHGGKKRKHHHLGLFGHLADNEQTNGEATGWPWAHVLSVPAFTKVNLQEVGLYLLSNIRQNTTLLGNHLSTLGLGFFVCQTQISKLEGLQILSPLTSCSCCCEYLPLQWADTVASWPASRACSRSLHPWSPRNLRFPLRSKLVRFWSNCPVAG